GTALASIKIGTVSGDDNPYMVEMVGGQYGDPGGNVAIGLIKSEGSTHPSGAWEAKCPVIGYFRGQFGVVIDVVQLASGNRRACTAFMVDPRINNGHGQSSHFVVHNLKHFHADNVVIDIANKKRWPAPGP